MKYLMFLTSLFFAIPTYADGVATGKIKGYVVNNSAVYVISEGTISDQPPCNTTGRYYFQIADANAAALLSVILASYHSGSELILTGTGDCDGGNSEVLRKVCTKDVPC